MFYQSGLNWAGFDVKNCGRISKASRGLNLGDLFFYTFYLHYTQEGICCDICTIIIRDQWLVTQIADNIYLSTLSCFTSFVNSREEIGAPPPSTHTTMIHSHPRSVLFTHPLHPFLSLCPTH